MTKTAKKQRAATAPKAGATRRDAPRARPSADAAAASSVPPPPPGPSGPPPWRILDRVQLSEALGVHADTVSDYVRKGMPVITMGGHGKPAAYDLVACMAWWRDQQGKNAKEAAQTRAFNAAADLNELKLLRERGDLLAREDVVKDGQAYTKAWANSIRAIARRARQAGIVTTPQAEHDLNALCRQLLTDIANWKTRADAERAAKKGVAA